MTIKVDGQKKMESQHVHWVDGRPSTGRGKHIRIQCGDNFTVQYNSMWTGDTQGIIRTTTSRGGCIAQASGAATSSSWRINEVGSLIERQLQYTPLPSQGTNRHLKEICHAHIVNQFTAAVSFEGWPGG